MTDNKNEAGTPTEEQLKKINKMSRRELSPDEVFVFPVVLCDNEVDRDYERFSIEALNKLAELYVGKTGIFDHSMNGRDQCARIFECKVVADQSQRTSAGETYHCLRATAYMTRTDSNRDLMLEIDAGIKKEVSVGCATAGRTCSVCGADLRISPCGHRLGKTYAKAGKKVVCHAILSDPTDAYEWSFVAVPAQRKAGVTKSHVQNLADSAEAVIKRISEICGSDFTDAESIEKQLAALTEKAEDGAVYRDELQKSAVRYCLLSQPAMTAEAAYALTSEMNSAALKDFADVCKKSAAAVLPVCPQLAHEIKTGCASDSNEYRI